MDISAIALAGVERASAQFQNAAVRVSGAADAGVDTVDLSTAAVAMLSARTDFAGNVQVLKIANQMQSHLVDLLA